jgi:ribonucleoside-diphosphate reductase alpha chain
MSCNLASINVNSVVRKAFSSAWHIDWDRLKIITQEETWALDDLLSDLGDRHALQGQKDHVIEWREIGLGIMGLADLALSTMTGYGSTAFLSVLEKVMSFITNMAFQASALRAKEKGSFPMYDYKLISESSFFKTALTEETKAMIQKYGLRNSRIISIAPNGSISNLLGVSGGVEPFFLLGYNRTIESMFEGKRTITVWEKTPQKLAKILKVKHIDELPDYAQVTSQNIEFNRRATVQSVIQRYTDTAISSTFNVPNSANVEDIMDIYVTAWEKSLKGATVFRDRCAKLGILTADSDKPIVDDNPAEFPHIVVHEIWTDKVTGVVRAFTNTVQIQGGQVVDSKIERELCPLCGDVLVKQGGCTKCNNNECLYEKCSI